MCDEERGWNENGAKVKILFRDTTHYFITARCHSFLLILPSFYWICSIGAFAKCEVRTVLLFILLSWLFVRICLSACMCVCVPMFLFIILHAISCSSFHKQTLLFYESTILRLASNRWVFRIEYWEIFSVDVSFFFVLNVLLRLFYCRSVFLNKKEN